MNMAVVGHVEWIEFAARRAPCRRRARSRTAPQTWEEPAGGGGVAAVELARLAGDANLFCLLGADELGDAGTARARGGLGPDPRGPERGPAAARLLLTSTTQGERTITVIGEKPRPEGGDGSLPWELLDRDGRRLLHGRRRRRAPPGAARARARRDRARARDAPDGGGRARRARRPAATTTAERYQAGDLDPPPKLVVSTAGALGGWAQPGGPYKAAAPTGPYEDTYGAGDCFAAGLTFALAQGLDGPEALAFASERGALALGRSGAGLTPA